MNIARASPFNYRNGRIRSSRRQLCWLYCDSMQIPPTAILQPIARTISSIVFPRIVRRIEKTIDLSRFIRGPSFHCISCCIIHIILRSLYRVNCCEFLCHTYTRIFVIKIHSENHAIEIAFSFISISRHTKIVNGSIDLYFSLETRILFPRIVQRLG